MPNCVAEARPMEQREERLSLVRLSRVVTEEDKSQPMEQRAQKPIDDKPRARRSQACLNIAESRTDGAASAEPSPGLSYAES